MTLADIDIPMTYEDASQYALLFSQQLADRMAVLHSLHGSANCTPMPRRTIDGRLMLSADVLSEVGPGGLLCGMWGAADKNVLNIGVEVIPWPDAVALLPSDPPIMQ